MAILNYSYNRRPRCQVRNWLTPSQIQEINEYLLRALNSFLNKKGRNDPNGWFAARDLVGGFNRDWTGSAWEFIYRVHKSNNEATAQIEAAKDMGWFLMNLLKCDDRTFETKYKYVKQQGKTIKIRIYRWI